MLKQVLLFSSIALAAAGLPQYAKDLQISPKAGNQDAAAVAPRPQQAKTSRPANYASGVRSVSVPMDNSGHFAISFRANGRSIHGLIDTGATYVAINESTARSIGLRLSAADFGHQVRTANGLTKAALVTIGRMEMGSISVSEVEAFVLADNSLSVTLIGMSFMSKLESYSVSGRTMELVN